MRSVNISGRCSVGPVDLDFLKVGQMNLTNLEIGDDGSLATAALDIDSGTNVHTISDSLVDKPIIVK